MRKAGQGKDLQHFFFGFLGLTTQQLGRIHSHKMSQVFIWALGKPCFFRKPASVFEKGAVFMTSTGKKAKMTKQDSHVFRLFPLHNCSKPPSPGESGMFVGSLWQVSVRFPVIRPMKATFWGNSGWEVWRKHEKTTLEDEHFEPPKRGCGWKMISLFQLGEF